MSDQTRLRRASRVFLAWLLIVYGTEAPDVLRRMADELDWLATDVLSEESPPQPGGAGSGGRH